jgi:methyl-accepting chemotaxis protein
MASTSEELSSQAEQLQDIMSFFKIDSRSGGGQVRRAMAPAARPAKKKQAALPPVKQASKVTKVTGGKGLDLDMGLDNENLDAQFERF